MELAVEYTDAFGAWWNRLTAAEQEDGNAVVIQLQRFGPALRLPYSSSIVSSRHSHMRELRVQHAGRPYRILYAFGPPAPGDPLDRRRQDRGPSMVYDTGVIQIRAGGVWRSPMPTSMRWRRGRGRSACGVGRSGGLNDGHEFCGYASLVCVRACSLAAISALSTTLWSANCR
jgi:hypothetical protein